MTKKGYIFHESTGHPIKTWTRGVRVEDSAMEQLRNVASLPIIHKHVAAMPDVHWGRGATVGSVIATNSAIIPAAVGVDLGCLDAETEFLSIDGWVRLDQYREGHYAVLQYDPITDEAQFVEPLAYIKKREPFFYHLYHTKGLDQMVCPRHKILFYKGYDRGERDYEIRIAEEFVNHHKELSKGVSGGFKTVFNKVLSEVEKIKLYSYLTKEELRVQIMIHADGCLRENISTRYCEVHLKKDRKIDRAKILLEAAGIEYTIYDHKDGTKTYRFNPPLFEKSLKFLFNMSSEDISSIVDELFLWDGYIAEDGQKTFSTKNKECADAVQFALACCGVRGGINKVEYHGKDWNDTYQVYTTKNQYVNMAPDSSNPVEEVESLDGYSYCFTVPSGFFVARRRGNIFITGNCGMNAVQTTLRADQLPDDLHDIRIDIERAVPHGFETIQGRSLKGGWDTIPASATTKWRAMEKKYEEIIAKHPGASHKSPAHQLGSLGGGNHFIEVCIDEDDFVWVMLHSGSRGAGNRIGTYFIEKAKEEMIRYHVNHYLPDQDLAYLVENTEIFDDYVDAVHWAQDYAMQNRVVMMDMVLRVLRDALPSFQIGKVAVNCHHNYVEKETHFGADVWVTRKGAVRAREDDFGIIPGSMGVGSFIVRGKGNPDSFCSCSHGAGRVMSRGEAKKMITVENHVKATEGIECRKDAGILDESPAAYKDLTAVMAAQEDLVEIVHRLQPVLNVKG